MRDDVQKIRTACVRANPDIIEEGTVIRDIYLSDVLHAVYAKWKIRMDQAMSEPRPFGKRSQYLSLEVEIKGRYWNIINMWNLKKPHLSSQSEALIRLIASIV